MNKSAMSQEVEDFYSQLIDVNSPALPKKSRFKKRMFAKHPVVIVPEDIKVLPMPLIDDHDHEINEGRAPLYAHLDPKLTGKRLVRQNSFDMNEKERQCFQLSEKGNLWIILALIAGVCF